MVAARHIMGVPALAIGMEATGVVVGAVMGMKIVGVLDVAGALIIPTVADRPHRRRVS
jgi:hypothetical protein